MNFNLFTFCENLINILSNVASKIWYFLTTPVKDLISNTPTWLNFILTPLKWLFQDMAIINALPLIIGIALLCVIVKAFIK